MKRVCAWCGQDMGEKEPLNDNRITHGMCEKCAEKIINEESAGLAAMQAESKLFIDANVWDGEDRSGATNDRATFNPDELQELINDMLEHMSN